MRFFKQSALLIAALSALIFSSGCGPKNFDVHREIVIKAPVNTVYSQISTHANFLKWSPWQELDTAQKITFEGTDGTVGAKYSWKGNDDVGEGSMTIALLEPGKRVEHDLQFLKPFESKSRVYMTTEPAEGGTKVVWGMKGESGLIERFFMFFMGGMDGAVGKDFEKGLGKLKNLCKSMPVYEVKETDWTEKNCLSYREVVSFKNMGAQFQKHLPEMYAAIKKAGAEPGIPLGVYYEFNEAEQKADFAVALPFDTKKNFGGNYKELNLPASKTYSVDYYGKYEDMKPAYDALDAKLKELGKTNPELVIEEYVGDPMAESDPSKVLARIYFFVK